MDKGIAREHCPVLDADGESVGFTTSGGPAPTIGKNVAMALVPAEVAARGAQDSHETHDEFFIEVRGRRLRAKRVKLPFYRSGAKG
jgi:aminomethyltransferase